MSRAPLPLSNTPTTSLFTVTNPRATTPLACAANSQNIPKNEEKTADSRNQSTDVASVEQQLRQVLKSKNLTATLKETISSVIKQKRFPTLLILAHENLTARQFIKHPSLHQFWSDILSHLNLKRHHFKNQPEDSKDKRDAFDIIAGYRCFTESQESADYNQLLWLTRGEFFGDYNCLDTVNRLNREHLDHAVSVNHDLPDNYIDVMLDRANRTAELHGAAGYGLLAATYHRLGRYYAKRLMAQRNADSILEDSLKSSTHCHRFFDNKKAIKPESPPDPHNYLQKRNLCYLQALKYITAAIAMEKAENYCEDITHNINFGKPIVESCSWVHKGTTDLSEMQSCYQEWVKNTRLLSLGAEMIKEGNALAEQITSDSDPLPAPLP